MCTGEGISLLIKNKFDFESEFHKILFENVNYEKDCWKVWGDLKTVGCYYGKGKQK